jgi:hypothetical protein
MNPSFLELGGDSFTYYEKEKNKMKREKINAVKRGKHPIMVNGQKIRTMVYIDYDGMFIAVKDARLKVKQSIDRRYYYVVGRREDVN